MAITCSDSVTFPPEEKHASGAMVVIVSDDTADLSEESLSIMNPNSMFSESTADETQESNVRATTRRGSPVHAFSYQTDDMDEITFAVSVSASGAVTRVMSPRINGLLHR